MSVHLCHADGYAPQGASVRIAEFELDAKGKQTGRKRRRQFAQEYAKAAKSGTWPSMAERAKWSVAFT